MARNVEVRNLKQTLDTLKQIDPTLYKQTRKRIRDDAKPLLQSAKDRIPQVPISGWVKQGRGATRDDKGQKTLRGRSGFPIFEPDAAKKGVKLSIRNRKRKGYGGRWLAVAMVQNDAAGIIFDLAHTSKNQNRFPRALDVRNPDPSRYMWKAAEQNLGTVNASMRASIRETEKIINRKLR